MTEDQYPECEGINCDEEALVELYELDGNGDHFYCIDCAIIRVSEIKKINIKIPYFECEGDECNENAVIYLFELDGTGDYRYCVNCAILRLAELKELETPLRKIGRKVGVTSVVGIR